MPDTTKTARAAATALLIAAASAAGGIGGYMLSENRARTAPAAAETATDHRSAGSRMDGDRAGGAAAETDAASPADRADDVDRARRRALEDRRALARVARAAAVDPDRERGCGLLRAALAAQSPGGTSLIGLARIRAALESPRILISIDPPPDGREACEPADAAAPAGAPGER